ncbi:MAG: hypothetical protein IJI20_05315 [Firmicutes bacterium]|nr:hypothetical protein [Bacillota bacterium]
MDYYELLKHLDLEEPADFIYFEAMADLVECDEHIEQEAVGALFAGADMPTVADLFGDYFDDIMDGLPEDSGEIYSLLNQIRLCLVGLARNAEDESDIRRLTDEFCRFRQWYVEDSDAELSPMDGGLPLHQCLRDAITTARMEKLGGEKYRYDFDYALDYQLDGYTMSFAELAAAEIEDDENEGRIVFDPETVDDYALDDGEDDEWTH